METGIYLVLNLDEDMTTGGLGTVPEQFFFANDAADAFRKYMEKANPQTPRTEYDMYTDSVKILHIKPGPGFIDVYVYNDNMEDWDDVDTTEKINR